MKIQTSELTGPALNWAVATVDGRDIEGIQADRVLVWNTCPLTGEREVVRVFQPSSDWSQGGPIIERECIDVVSINGGTDGWMADKYLASEMVRQYGDTPLIAAMRCYVASLVGNEVDVPEELLEA